MTLGGEGWGGGGGGGGGGDGTHLTSPFFFFRFHCIFASILIPTSTFTSSRLLYRGGSIDFLIDVVTFRPAVISMLKYLNKTLCRIIFGAGQMCFLSSVVCKLLYNLS